MLAQRRFMMQDLRYFPNREDVGLIQFLILELEVTRKIFIEFGVGNDQESNTRFHLMEGELSC